MPIEPNDIPKTFLVGRKYHCSWAANRGYVWILTYFNPDKNTATLITPFTKKVLRTRLSSLRNINKNKGL